MTSSSAKLPYRADIDGLRAIAILLVVFFHAGLGCRGGFIGVDVFFVISGFLITGILLRELDAGNFSLLRFWHRRVRRLFPVLLVVLAVTLATGWAVLVPVEFAQLGDHALATLASVANFRLQNATGYWAPQADFLPLLHMWSLAVEEQFYLLFPLLLALGHRFVRARLGTALVVLGAISLGFCLLQQPGHPKSTFYLLPGRAWELLLGAMTSYALHRGFKLRESVAPFAAWLGLGLVIIPAFTLEKGVAWPGPLTLLPTVGTVLLIIGHAPRHFVSRLLSVPPIRFVGLISYSLYLWHWPALVFLKLARYPAPVTRLELALALLFAVALSAVTWRFVEHPFRFRTSGPPLRHKPFFAVTLGAWTCLLVISVAVWRTQGWEKLFYQRLPASAGVIQRRPANESVRRYSAASSLERGGVQFNCAGRPPAIVVLGSSHGMMLGPLFERLSAEHQVPLAMLTQDGTPGLFAGENTFVIARGKNNVEKRRRDEIVQRLLAEWKPAWVIITGRWDSETASVWADDPERSLREFQAAFAHTVGWLTNHAAQVAVVGQVPLLPLPNDDNTREILVRYRRNDFRMPVFFERPEDAARRRAANLIFTSLTNQQVRLVSLEGKFLRPDGAVRYFNDEAVLYQDDDHLNRLGALELRAPFEFLFRDAKARATPERR